MTNARLFILLQLFVFLYTSKAQSVDAVIGNYTGANANGFLQPLADVLTSSFNTGSVYKTSIENGFHIHFGIIATNAFILGNNLKYFDGQTPDNFQPMQTASVSTILGPANITTVDGKNGTSYSFPAGLGLSSIRLAVPQMTIGSVFGTEISIRYFAYNVGGDFGKLIFKGGGIRHDFGKYFLKKSKIKLTAELGYQELQTGKYSNLTALKIGVYAGKQFKILHYFGYLGFQQGKLDINYQNPEDGKSYNFQLNNKNPLLIGVGAGAKLGVLSLHTQINFISPIAIAAGIGLNF